MVDRPKVGVGVFVIRDGKVLVGQRQGSHGAGTWSLPGGHLEFAEKVANCAKREVLEEAGVQIDNIQELIYTNDYDPAEGTHYVTLFVRADWVAGEAKIIEPEKCLEWRWVEWPNVPKPHFLPVASFLKTGMNPLE